MLSIMYKKILPYMLALAAMFILSACGGGGEEITEEENGYDIDFVEPEPTSNIRTLSVTRPEFIMAETMLLEAVAHMRRQLEQEGMEFVLETNVYSPEEQEAQLIRFQTMMMAGQSYDIFMFDHQPLWAYARSGFLADIYELIDQCPRVNREDFYTNVLEAFEYDGRLISLPFFFGFRYVGINASLPQHFIDRFKGHSQISMYELFQIYNELQQDYWEDFGHMNLLNFIDPQYELQFAMGNYIDINTRSSSITDDSFVSFLTAFRQVNDFGGFLITDMLRTPMDSRSDLSEFASAQAFYVPISFYSPALAFIDTEDPYFVHHIPISGACGSLEMRRHDKYWIGNFSISASADGSLALDFLMHLLSVQLERSTPSGGQYFAPLGTFSTPIFRPYVERHRTTVFRHTFTHIYDLVHHRVEGMAGLGPVERLELENQITENAIQRLSGYNEMPIAIAPFVPITLYEGVMDGLLGGFITPEDAAQQLQNSITLWLIE